MPIQKSAPVLSLLLSVLAITLALPAEAQTYTNLASFQPSSTGSEPEAPLIQGIDGNFYGTTIGSGAYEGGTVYELTPDGTLTILYSFCLHGGCTAHGTTPYGGLVQPANGNFYGTTSGGGANGDGTVFELTHAGKLTVLHNFAGTDGIAPRAGLLLASDGNFYGTTTSGGTYGYGTVFRITPAGVLITMHSFNRTAGEGYFPYAPLIESNNGDFYGTAVDGGANNAGTIFKITPAGALTTLHSFDVNIEGYEAYSGLVRGSDGNFYGATAVGGPGYGSIFKITPAGALTVLYGFNFNVGAMPAGTLVQATDGNFYGTTYDGGAGLPEGTAFQITPAGVISSLYNFQDNPGESPWAGLLQSTDGTFYGSTLYGGNVDCGPGCGTLFSLNTGLAASVKTVPVVGRIGMTVVILGNDLAGASAVTFNGVPATFTVVSSTEIKATVPAGATSGMVTVTTPSGTVNSNPKFLVVR